MTKPRIPWPTPPTRKEAAVRDEERTTSQWLRFGDCERAQEMRAIVQRWLGAVDDAEHRDAVRGLMAGNDAVLCQNFAELVVGAWLRGQALNYTRPPVALGEKRPDFEVQVDGQTFYVEVVTSTGLPRASKPRRSHVLDQEAMARTERFRRSLRERLARRLEEESGTYELNIILEGTLEGTPGSDPPVVATVDRIVRWLRNGMVPEPEPEANDDVEEGDVEHLRFFDGPVLSVPLRDNGATLSIHVRRRAVEGATKPRISGNTWFNGAATVGTNFEPERVLRGAVERKFSKYGEAMPLVVVLCIPEAGGDVIWPEDPLLALYGERFSITTPVHGGGDQVVGGQMRDGPFATRAHPHLCGVLVIGDMCPTRFARVKAFWAPNPAYMGPTIPDWFAAAGRVEIEVTRGEPVVVPAAAGAFWSACVGTVL